MTTSNDNNFSTAAPRPTVAVVMCTYNGERFLRQQLDSILAQTYPLSEIIVQDDRSTDSTVAILRDYERRDQRLRVYVNDRNLGFNLNFKTACMRATADFIAISDQDDIWLSDKIERQVSAIGTANICFSTHTRGRDMATAHTVVTQYSLPALLFGGIAGHTMLLRRDFLQRDEAWLDRFFYDWSLAVDARFYGSREIRRIDTPLNWHRSHDGETALLQNLALFPRTSRRPTWQPYVYGLRNYRRLQRKEAWTRFYSFVHSHSAPFTADASTRLAHTMAGLMLRPGLLPLLRLMWLCMCHRSEVYPDASRTRGLRGAIRGLFFPFIFSYRCSTFDL